MSVTEFNFPIGRGSLVIKFPYLIYILHRFKSSRLVLLQHALLFPHLTGKKLLSAYTTTQSSGGDDDVVTPRDLVPHPFSRCMYTGGGAVLVDAYSGATGYERGGLLAIPAASELREPEI